MSNGRKCLFCGNDKLSKEHIFAQWLLKELDIFNSNVDMTHSNFVGYPLSRRTHPYSKLVNGLVCQNCNNGWMSKLEYSCKDHIINLMNGINLEDEINYLIENNETVAKWAFKNAIMLNSATNYRQLVPKNHYQSLYSGIIPNGIFVDIAFYKGKTGNEESNIEWIQSPNPFVIKDSTIPFNPNKKSYRITYRIKRLLFSITFYESEHKTLIENNGAIQLYPQFGLYDKFKTFNSITSFSINGVLNEYK